MPVIEIDGRIKRLWSIHQKLRRSASSSTRSTTSSPSGSSPTASRTATRALGIIHQTWSPVPGRIKDFIAMPRPNGYQSLHTSVISEHGMPFEVQIRTIEMHRMAEEGVAAHWKYKEGRIGDHKDDRYFQWMRQLLEYQQEVRDPQEFIQNLKVELYPEEVYTFTPKGQVKAFPRGATPIDFAYSIHTDVGHQCVGARVNGKMVPLRARLKNGDIVEIITAVGTQAEPRLAQLRRHVARPLQDQAPASASKSAPAPSIWAARCSRKSCGATTSTPRRCSSPRHSAGSLAKPAPESPEDLFALIGYGTVSAKQLLGKLVPAERLREKAPDGAVVAAVRRVLGTGGDEKIKVRGGVGRSAGLPGPLLQSDPRRENRRLHHARQRRLSALRHLPQRDQPALRSRAADRCRMGQGRHARPTTS